MNFKAILAWARSVETSEHSPPLCHPRPQQTRANFANILDGEWEVSNYGTVQYTTKKSEYTFSQAATELCDAPISGSSVPSEASSLPTKHTKSPMKPKEMLSGEDKMHCSHSEVESDIQKTTMTSARRCSMPTPNTCMSGHLLPRASRLPWTLPSSIPTYLIALSVTHCCPRSMPMTLGTAEEALKANVREMHYRMTRRSRRCG